MKNKKFLAVAAGICLFATVGYANNYLISGLGFVAPSIIGKSNIYNPEVGEIVYDSVDSTFYGYNQSGQWQALNGGGSSSPTGAITAFGGTTAPNGYLLCDGSIVSRTTYASLYAVIGDSYGAGDGVNTFQLPDFRGRFLRGVDNGAGRDISGRTAMNVGGDSSAIGSYQNDAFQGHHHAITTETGPTGNSGIVNRQGGASNTPGGSAVKEATTDGINGAPRTASETRPKNVSVNFIIKI